MGGRQGYTGYVRANTYACPNLDINKMAKAGVFSRHCQFEITFPCESVLEASFDGSNLTLKPDTGDQRIYIEAQHMNFGGVRYYFLCPGCYDRRTKLYWGDDGFYCRRCYRLVYRSQQRGDLDWALETQRKIGRQLDGKMRQTKRARLEAEFYELDDCVTGHFLKSLMRLTGEKWPQ